MVLRLGSKFARVGDLKGSLKNLAESTYFEFEGMFRRLHNATEYEGLRSWRRNVNREIGNMPREKWTRRELLLSKGLRDLKAMNCIIKQADKNLGIVPIQKNLYRKMAEVHVLDTETYGRVPWFPRKDIIGRMRRVCGTARTHPKLVERWLALATDDAEPAPFYILPKLHKKKMFTSRPVTVQHSYLLGPLSKALAEQLQVYVDRIPEIAKDTKTVAQRLNEFHFQRPGVFLTYDVVSLYPSIDLHDAIDILEKNVPVLSEKNGFWLKVLKLVMFNNYIKFEGNIYRQLRGTATGTAVAPPFANLYMYHKYIEVLTDESIQIQRRYIDDGFLVVDTESDAKRIMASMKAAGQLDFTFDVSNKSAIFLDLEIYKGQRFERDKKLDMKPYFKPTNRFLYLPAISNHPWHMKLGIARGEAIRCLRNSTDKSAWLRAMHGIFKALIARGYCGEDLQRQWSKIRWEQRDHYLYGEGSQKTKPEGTLIFTSFHHKTKSAWRSIITKHSLKRRLRLRGRKFTAQQAEIVDKWPPKIIFKEFPKIGRFLISARETVTPMERGA